LLFKNETYFTATSPKLNCATLNACCGQFHQHFIIAFAPISLRQKKFNLYFKHKKALCETFIQKAACKLLVKLTPVEKNRIYDSLKKMSILYVDRVTKEFFSSIDLFFVKSPKKPAALFEKTSPSFASPNVTF
jgi:hypothetical protein